METLARDNVKDIMTWENVARMDYTDEISKNEENLALKISNCLEAFGIHADASLLELGSGSGHISAILSQKGYDVTLIDFSENILARSKTLFQSKGLKAQFVCGDIFNANQFIRKQYDVTWNSGVMEHFNTQELLELFKTIKGITRHYYLCVVPNTESLPYLLFRYKAMKTGRWLYGMEFLRDDYEKIAKEAGFELKEKRYLGGSFTTDYIRYFFGDKSGQDYQEFLEADFLPEKESYLVLYLFQKQEDNQDIYPRVYSSCERKTINFDYITALQKENRSLLKESHFKKIAFCHDQLFLNNHRKRSDSSLQKALSVVKKHGLFSVLKIVAREFRRSGVSNTIHYLKSKLEINKPMESIAPDDAGNAIKSAIDLMHYLHQCNLIKGIVFIDCAFDFDEARNQRSISLANELNAQGYFVFFLRYQWNEYDTSTGDYKLFRDGIMQIPRLKTEQLVSDETINNIQLERYFILTIPDDFLLKNYLSIRQAGIKICYDIIDHWKGFNSAGAAPWYNESTEQFFINNADVVTAVSRRLISALGNAREIKLVSNGLFGSDNFLPLSKGGEKYHLGYIGHLTDKWFNWEYVFKLLEDKQFVLHIIGEGAPPHILKKIKKYSNIIFYGYIPKNQLTQYACNFNVGLIPFVDSELSHCVDPLKVYDYLQFGRPVVSTGIPHLSDYPHCINTITFEDFKEAIIKLSEVSIDKAAVCSFLEENNWSRKAGRIIHFLERESIIGDMK